MNYNAPWNKGLTKETDERVRSYANTILDNLKSGKTIPAWLNRHHTEKTKSLLVKYGGYHGGGKGIKGYYKGFWCDSSWELAYVIYNLEHDILFERNIKTFKYEYEGKIHTYLPDYYIRLDNTYIEIKGWENERWKSKINQFPNKLIVIKKKDIKKYLNYVIQKYGKDFIKLYDKDKFRGVMTTGRPEGS
jgi:hypothetical protein